MDQISGISSNLAFDEPDIQIPTCVFCQNAFSIKEGRTPYILPCQEHSSCKQCLRIARQNKLEGLACPIDKVEIGLANLKSLQKNIEILQFIEQLEQYQEVVMGDQSEEQQVSKLILDQSKLDFIPEDPNEEDQVQEEVSFSMPLEDLTGI